MMLMKTVIIAVGSAGWCAIGVARAVVDRRRLGCRDHVGTSGGDIRLAGGAGDGLRGREARAADG